MTQTSTEGPVRIAASDGHEFDCWFAPGQTEARGSVIVLQEVFGVNSHIRAVCARLARRGYDAYAPALFDRIQPGFTSGYSRAEIDEALKILPRVDWQAMVLDTLATAARAGGNGRPVALMGFCLGASLAYMAAQRQAGLAAVVGYYGGQIVQHLDTAPQCPTLLHYGAKDHTIPMENVESIRAARPDCEVHVYPAGHGFNCDERASFEPASASLAWERSMKWLEKNKD